MQAKIKVNGIVQGVGFRPFIYRIAVANGLHGYVLNLGDAGVEIVVEGEEKKVKKFIEEIEKKSPPLAQIDEMNIQWRKEEGFKTFKIRKSVTRKEGLPSIIPPDIGICDDCLAEMNDKSNRRYNYFFTTCTNCGPRYTTIKTLPYDRPNTTMDEFPMCNECQKEYTNPMDRRYHAQTIACKKCGPQVYLQKGRKIIDEGENAIWKAGELLMKGSIIAIKGNGGFHLACSVFFPKSIKKLREMLGRENKPFAVMAKNIEMAEEFAFINEKEREMLLSFRKPIVVLDKKKDLPFVSPDLHTIGVMLPYTGLHVMLFQKCSHPLIMTSANMPGEPIIYSNKEALKKLKGKVDFFLFYDRKIYQRCDDSVVRVVDGTPLLMRRSRGYAPSPILLPFSCKNVLALGAEMNVTSCILVKNKAFLSQYIGDTRKYDTFQFLKDATSHLLHLTNVEIEIIACDLHPQFATTKLAYEIGGGSIPVHQVQHHHAHIAKVMAENGVDETIGIAIDGFGYGEDGNAWGGEVLHCDYKKYERIGHLEEHLMPGGDLATYYPLRLVASILHGEEKIKKFLMEREKKFPHGKEEIKVVLHQIEKGKGVKTTSCGRILDAAAALLDICHERTYEGEPAMKLESVAVGGKNIISPPEIDWKKGILKTEPLFAEIFKKKREKKRDLAYSVEEYIAKGLAEIAIANAEERGIKTIAIAGGCVYNAHISGSIRKVVEQHGLRLIKNKNLPPGDGGISFGQAVVACHNR